MKDVVIIQTLVKQYRRPFFERLHAALAQQGIRLRVLYGEPHGVEASKGDNVELASPCGTKVKNVWLAGDRLLFQPVLGELKSADLVVVEQANKHLVNYLLLLMSALKMKTVAFWGHGYNHQAQSAGLSEWLKKQIVTAADWWFAYTQGTADYLVACGVSADRVTCVNNSVDTAGMRADLAAVSAADVSRVKAELGIGEEARIALFCGSLYREKCLEFMLQAAWLVKRRVPGFELLIVGDGPECETVRRAACEHPWVHQLGARFGAEKATYFRLAEVVVNPGLVGLTLLDAFSAGLPLVTTDFPYHSPEIAYLENGRNGVIVRHDPAEYAAEVAALLEDRQRLEEMGRCARDSAGTYSLDAMVARFAAGIGACLRRCDGA